MRLQPETVHEYNILRLNWIFAGCSLLFLACVGWMIYDDWEIKKPWKQYQREFAQIEARKLTEDAVRAEQRAQQLGLDEIQEQLAARNAELAGKKEAVETKRGEWQQARVAFELLDRDSKFEKANLDAQKYLYDAAYERIQHENPDWTAERIREHPAVAREARNFAALDAKVERLRLDAQNAELRLKEREAELEALVGERDELERRIATLLTEKRMSEKRIALLQDRVVNLVLNAPILEFARPTLKVDQKIIEHYTFDVNFAQAKRVDRCMTCHVAADKRSAFHTVALRQPRPPPYSEEQLRDLIAQGKAQGRLTYEDIQKWVEQLRFPEGAPKGLSAQEWAQLSSSLRAARVEIQDFYSSLPHPFKSHPRLDLFVASDSPHPASQFGCTICHWGWDREVEFRRAAHTPNDEKQLAEWLKKYHWHPAPYFEQPMRPARFVEAGCLKCHTQVTEVPRADKLNLGRALIETAGCYGCHQINQLETILTHKIEPSQGVNPAVALNPKLSYDEKQRLIRESLGHIAALYNVSVESLQEANIISKPSDLLPGRILNVPLRKLHKRAPTLTQIAAKTTPEWTRQWLDSPRGFRPNTWMPHFWNLDNSADPVRDALEINALTQYLFAISDRPSLPEPPVRGDALRGRTLVETVGCFACHMVGESYEQLREEKRAKLRAKGHTPTEIEREMLQFERNLLLRSRGPSLDKMGAKTNPAWLYAWLKDPKALYPKTRMPNLRLTDQEAADITAYLMSLQAQPSLLPPLPEHRLDALTQEYLENQMPRARALEQLKDMREPAAAALGAGYRDADIEAAVRETLSAEEFERTMADDNRRRAAWETMRLELGRRRLAEGGYDSAAQKNIFLGRWLVDRYGCFGCHDIKGFEKAKPIGAELTEWGSKAVKELDFGYLPAHLVLRSNVGFLQQKLKAPRSLDRVDTKKPQELLKMPQFAFNTEQIEAVTTHILGQTKEKISLQGQARLTPARQDIENGRWLVKELNCVGCHVFEAPTRQEGFGGAIYDTIADPTFHPPSLYTQGAKTQPQWLFKFLRDPSPVRPTFFEGHARMPSFSLTDEEINILIRYFAALDNQQFPFEQQTIAYQPDAESVKLGEEFFQSFRCVQCHNIVPGRPATAFQLQQAGPDLALTKGRLKPHWVQLWLEDPQKIAPGTRMPAFWTERTPQALKEIQALRDFLWLYPGLRPEDLVAPPVAAPTESFE